jgi:hypothetical protein
MNTAPQWLSVFFIVTTAFAVWQFYRAAQFSKKVLGVLLGWMVLQMAIGLTGFYTNTTAMPPRFALLIAPPLLLTAVLFLTPAGKRFIDALDFKSLTLLHTVRIPVEMALYYLFIAKTIPGIMTFEGCNFDIIAGITALPVYYFRFIRPRLGRRFLLGWNIVCTGLLLNIVIIAILSAATPLQRFGFQQPNIAIAWFPFVWLPSVIVPLVLFSHLAAMRLLLKKSPLQ